MLDWEVGYESLARDICYLYGKTGQPMPEFTPRRKPLEEWEREPHMPLLEECRVCRKVMGRHVRLHHLSGAVQLGWDALVEDYARSMDVDIRGRRILFQEKGSGI